jgi:hypothetical protein
VAKGQKTYIVGLGEHIDIPYSFVVPALYEGFIDRCDIEFIVRKKSEVKFRETKSFSLRNNSFKGETSPRIILSEAHVLEYQ